MEKQAEELKLKEQYLTSISHELRYIFNLLKRKIKFFRSPVFGILESLNLLNDTKLTSEQQQLVHIGRLCGEQLLVSLIHDIKHTF